MLEMQKNVEYDTTWNQATQIVKHTLYLGWILT